jgi:hypothetical protein
MTLAVTESLTVPETFEHVSVYVRMPTGMSENAWLPVAFTDPVQSLSELEAMQDVAYWLVQDRVYPAGAGRMIGASPLSIFKSTVGGSGFTLTRTESVAVVPAALAHWTLYRYTPWRTLLKSWDPLTSTGPGKLSNAEQELEFALIQETVKLAGSKKESGPSDEFTFRSTVGAATTIIRMVSLAVAPVAFWQVTV